MVNRVETLDYSELRRCLHYDPMTGHFTWLVQNGSRGVLGSRAGRPHGKGYRAINLNKRQYKEHRLAWFYMTMQWPPLLDHADENKANNAWVNLRVATYSQNAHNQGLTARNTSGHRGVSWDKQHGNWAANIRVNGVLQKIGRFDSKELAAKAYQFHAQQVAQQFFKAV